MNSLSLIIRNLENAVLNCQNFFSNNTLETYTEQVINVLCSSNSVVEKTIKEAAFKNLPPKIGFFDETTIASWTSINSENINISNLPIFIGGYYNAVTVSSPLNKNAINYVYLYRQDVDTVKLQIATSQKGVDNFSVLYVAKIITDLSGAPTNTEFEKIDNYTK